MAAPLVRGTRGVLAGGCETLRSPGGVHCGAGRAGQGIGLHPTEGQRVAAVEMVVPGTGRARRQRRDLREHLALDGAQVAVRGCPQTVAVPVVDVHHGSELRRASAESVGSICQGMGMGNRWAATTM